MHVNKLISQASFDIIMKSVGLLTVLVASCISNIKALCPEGKYGEDCSLECICEWNRTQSCHELSGKCICKLGFEGKLCEHDVNECLISIPCEDHFTYCRNTIGSFECSCISGYKLRPSGHCHPCPYNKNGIDCTGQCDCKFENTLTCEVTTGVCICKPGWEGERCSKSTDDCADNPCPEKSCTDLHRSHSCVCGDNKRALGEECVDAVVDFVSLNTAPKIGELVDAYFLFSVNAAYQRNPTAMPNFRYSLETDSAEAYFQGCIVDFHHSYQHVKGDETFIRMLKSKISYHFYIRLELRFKTPKLVTVKAAALMAEYPDRVLVFDARYIDVAEEACLSNITISGSNGIEDSFLAPPHYKRQEYHRFTATFNSSADCLDRPKVEWIYYLIHNDAPQYPDSCLTHQNAEKLDIDDLIDKSGHLAITDHREPIEIMPQNSLPLGVILICLSAHCHRDSNIKSHTCGYIKIVPSTLLEGHVIPRFSAMSWPLPEPLTLRPNYYTTDIRKKLIHLWTCSEDSCLINRQGDDVNVSSTPASQPSTVHVYVAVEDFPEIQVSDTFIIHYKPMKRPMYFTLHCKQGCQKVVGTFQEISYYATLVIPNSNGLDSQFRYQWSVEVNNHTLTDSHRILEIFARGVNDPILYIKPGALKPNSVYTFTCRASTVPASNDSEPFVSIAMTTEKAPSGDGCYVTPTSGQAVITRFQITCTGYLDTVGNQPLAYKLYEKETLATGETVYTVSAYGSEPVMEELTLSPTNTDRYLASEAEIRMEIINMAGTGTSTVFTIPLQVIDQDLLLNNLSTFLEDISLDNQIGLRRLKDVAAVIGFNSTATVETKRQARRKLLHALFQFKPTTRDTLEQASFLLLKVVENGDRIEHEGLVDGLNAARKLSRELSRVRIDTMDSTHKVARFQMYSLGILSSETYALCQATLHDKLMDPYERTEKIKQIMELGHLITNSVSEIALVLMDTLLAPREPFKFVSDNVELAVEWGYLSASSFFHLRSDDGHVELSLRGRAAGARIKKKMKTEFVVFKKNPFVAAAENIHGDLPLLQVNIYQQPENETKRQTFRPRFSEPADIFIDFNSTWAEAITYQTLIGLKGTKEKWYVQHSSCIVMSVRASSTEATVLKISSSDNLTLLVKALYTNDISGFDLTSDEDMLQMPLRNITDSDSKKFARQEDLLFLPMLPKIQVKKKIPFFRIKITVKLNQVFQKQPLADTGSTPGFIFYNTTIRVSPYKMACMHFDHMMDKFRTDQCMITMFSDLSKIHCRCVVAAAFTGSYLMIPTLLQPIDIGLFMESYDNPLVVSVAVAIWMIFLAALFYGRRRDQEDKLARRVTVLDDNQTDHCYVYLLCVGTAWLPKAATTSKVFIVIQGTLGKSQTHLLKDESRRLFESGTENWFLLTAEDDLGVIVSVTVWIDFSGEHPSWFLNSIFLQDMQTSESWICPYEDWLSVEFGRKTLWAEIQAIKEADYESKRCFRPMNFRNEHIWFGMVAKTSYNQFTRVHRMATAVTMLQSLMILNLIFFELADFVKDQLFFEILHQKIRVATFFIGLLSSVLMTVVGSLVAYLFYCVAPKPEPKKKPLLSDDRIEHLDSEKGYLTFRGSYPTSNETIPLSSFKSDSHGSEDGDTETPPHPNVRFSYESSVDPDMFHQLNHSGKRTNKLTSSAEDALFADAIQKQVKVEIPDSDTELEVTQRKASAFKLPWWFINITWTAVVLLNFYLTYYVMLYGLSLSYELSFDWALAFFVGFIANVLVIQPCKVVVTVLMFALLCRPKSSFKDRAPVTSLKDGLQLVHKKNIIKHRHRSLLPKTVYMAPMQAEEVQVVLDRLKVESNAKKVVRNLFFYVIYLVSIILVVYGHLDISTQYLHVKFTKNIYLGIRESFNKNNCKENLFHEVKSVEGIWNYLHNTLIVRLAPDELGTNLPISTHLLGPARIRQVRVQGDADGCSSIPDIVRKVYGAKFCDFTTNEGLEETRSYFGSWKFSTEEPIHDQEHPEYVYHTGQSLRTIPFIGHHGTYSGGGFVATLSRDDLDMCREMLSNLSKLDWVDSYTRCLFVEFNLYNPGADLFTSVILVFEFDLMGGVLPSYHISTARFYLDNSKKEGWLQIAEVITGACIIFDTWVAWYEIHQCGLKAYCLCYWNSLEIMILIMRYMAGILYLLRTLAYQEALDEFSMFGHGKFIDYQTVFHRNFEFSVCMGFTVALSIFKVLKIVMFNPFFSIFIKTFETTKKGIAGFFLIAIILITGLTFSGMLIFGHQLLAYMTFDRSFFTLLFFILGEPFYDDLIMVDKFFGPVFFFSSFFLTQYFIMNFFISILTEGLEVTMFMEYAQERAAFKYIVDSGMLMFGLAPHNYKSFLKSS